MQDYLPRPKVVAAFLSAILVVALLWLVQAVFDVEVDGVLVDLLPAFAALAGGYVKTEP